MDSNSKAESSEGGLPMDPSMVCLSVIEDGPSIAFASYNEDTNVITLEQCLANGYEAEGVVQRVLSVIRPTLLLVSTKIMANENLMQILTEGVPETDAIDNYGEDEEATTTNGNTSSNNTTWSLHPQQRHGKRSSSIPYQAMKSSAFDVRLCQSLILKKLRVRSIMRGGSVGSSSSSSAQSGAILRNDAPQRRFPLAPSLNERGLLPISTYHALASLIDFDSKIQVQALGSLLSFLGNSIFRVNGEGSHEGGIITVSDIVPGNSGQYMAVSADTLASLHIFATEHHPLSVARGGGNAKEGFSLFSLLDRTQSRSGRDCLREWMLRPLIDAAAICERQNSVELFLRPEIVDSRKTLSKLISNVAAIDRIYMRILKCCAKPQDFIAFVRSLDMAINIFSVLQNEVLWTLHQYRAAAEYAATRQVDHQGGDYEASFTIDTKDEEGLASYIEITENILKQSSGSLLQDMAHRLKEAIDLEATSEWHCVLIRSGYDEELDRLKDCYADLPQTLKHLSDEQCMRFPELAAYMDAIFLPQIGFHIRLKDDPQWLSRGQLPEELSFIFTEGGFTFFKTAETRMLDESIGDIDSNIKDKEALLVSTLEEHMLDYQVEIQDAFKAIAELDCILAFSSCAHDLGYVRPEIVSSDEKCIQILNGRHPLQELEKSFIPNDTIMDYESRINVLTGPNYSGKSCYARQVGVLVYMAQLGSFIPCDVSDLGFVFKVVNGNRSQKFVEFVKSARISVFRQLFTRFAGIETCSVPQSSFQLDLSQLGQILRRAVGSSSLVLIDEFGKGTSPASGIALLSAALLKLSSNKVFAICTTHFLEIFSMNLLRDGELGIKAHQMAVQIQDTGSQTAFPLFRLKEGAASTSAGLVCAQMAGLKSTILERAAEIVEATNARRQVSPLTEILRDNLNMKDNENKAIAKFLLTDWSSATVKDIESLLSLLG